MIHRRKFKGKCRCGQVLMFHQGPRGFKTTCSKCGAVVRLKAPPLRSDSGTVYNVPDSKILISCPCGEVFATTFYQLGRRVACPECGEQHLVRDPRSTSEEASDEATDRERSDTDEIETVKS